MRALLAVAILVTSPGVALAHPDVDRARGLYESGDLDAALSAYDEAEAAEQLEREDLLAILEGRCLIYYARNRRDRLAESLSVLASLAPEHAFGSEAPPELIGAFQEAVERSPGQIAIDVEVVREATEVHLTAEVRNDIAGLTQRVELFARTPGGPWRRSDDGRLSHQAGLEPVVEYYAIAHGPGGAVIARTGSEASPRQAAAILPTDDDLRRDRDDGDGSIGAGVWILLGVGVAAVIAGVIVTVVVLNDTEADMLQVGTPTWPMVPFGM